MMALGFIEWLAIRLFTFVAVVAIVFSLVCIVHAVIIRIMERMGK